MKTKYELIRHFAALGFTKGAEIGVSKGHLSEAMFKTIPDLKLYCVDIWQPYKGNRWSASQNRNDEYFKIAKERLSKYNAMLMKESSMDAVKKFEPESLDFVYIDSNHSFDYVMEDLINWSRVVKSGGIVSGDDYYKFRGAGVVEAVDAYTKAHGIEFSLTDPLTYKIRDRNGFEQPSFYWIKR